MAEKKHSNTGAPRPGMYAVFSDKNGDEENLTGYRFRSRDRALAKARSLREQYPGACVQYWPTAAEFRRICAQQRSRLAWGVRYWQVYRTGDAAAEPLSPMYANQNQALRALAHFQREDPDCYLMKHVANFNPARADELAERAALLAAMAPIAS